jgi:hypothetical protein
MMGYAFQVRLEPRLTPADVLAGIRPDHLSAG